MALELKENFFPLIFFGELVNYNMWCRVAYLSQNKRQLCVGGSLLILV